MHILTRYLTPGFLAAAIFLAGCSPSRPASPDVVAPVRQALDQAGLKDVKVDQDRAKGIVTLSGHVISEAEKAHAVELATPLAAGQVVAMEIAVVPVGLEKDARAINENIDEGISKNLQAALISAHLDETVKFEVKNAVVTLSGDVHSQTARAQAADVATGVPYVKQVVNTIQVKGQKATSTV